VRVLDASTSPPKERYAVSNDNVNQLIQPGIFDDQLTEVFRSGARALLAKAVEAEVADPQHILHASRIAIATQTRVYLLRAANRNARVQIEKVISLRAIKL